MTIYKGFRGEEDRAIVVVDVDGTEKPLPTRNDLFNHSPNGFEWGYGGSGPAQLALAILAHHFQQMHPVELARHVAMFNVTVEKGESLADKLAVHLHQRFKFQTVAALPRDGSWELRAGDVWGAIDRLRADAAPAEAR
jgi:hypothetical protein